MLGTIELQVKTSTFLATQIAKYRTAPWCPPAAQYGIQLQRVRFGAAVIRQTVPDEFTVSWRDYHGEIAPAKETAKGFKTQLDVEVELDLTTETAIAANPNKLPPDLLVLRPHVVFDLYAIPSDTDGCILVMSRSGVEWPPGSVPTLPPGVPVPPGVTPASILDPLIVSMLPSISVPVNLDTGTLGAKNVINAGLAADDSGNRLVLRAESFTANDNPTRWTNFHRGAISDRLGSSDWSLFLRAVDVTHLLNVSVWDSLRDKIDPSGKAHVISCATGYAPGNGSAAFTTVVHLRVTPDLLPDFNQSVPLVTTFSVDSASGNIQVEVWLKGIEQFVNDTAAAFDSAMFFVPTVLAIPLRALFGEGRSYLEDELSGVSVGSLGDLEFKHVTPYLLRATLPIPSPKLLGPTAKVTQLVADPDGFSLQGTWPQLNLTDSQLKLEPTRFEWRGPDFSCGEANHGIEQQIRDNPLEMTHLTASVVLSKIGQLPISLCSAHLVNPAAEIGPELTLGFTASSLPTTVSLAAPGTWAKEHPNLPISVALRTSSGVLNVVIPACGVLSPAMLNALAEGAEIKVRNCERVIPEAFEKLRKGEKFDVAWIEQPLVDPPRPEEISPKAGDFELWFVQAVGLSAGENLFLGTATNNQVRGARVNTTGRANLATMFPAGEVPVLSATRSLGEQHGAAKLRHAGTASTSKYDRSRAQGLSVFRQRYVRGASVRLGALPRDLVAVPGLGRGRFAALVGERVLEIAARNPLSPMQLRVRQVAGAQGLLPLCDAVLAYGKCGALVLEPNGGVRQLVECGAEVLAAAVVGEQVAVLRRGVIEIRALNTGCVHETRALEAAALAQYAGQLLIAHEGGIWACRGVAVGALQRLPLHLPGQVTSLKQAEGCVFAQLDAAKWVRLDVRAHAFETIEGLPWELRFPACAGVAAKVSARRRCIDFYSVLQARGTTPCSAHSHYSA